jgi:GT2 family glycosyltransferase
MARPKVTILITSHSNKDQLVLCLESVYRQVYDGSISTVVIDNASRDNSVLIVTSRYPQVHLIQNKVNRGIGASLNQGLADADGELIVTLHQDVELQRDWIERLVAAFDSNPTIGAACGMTIYQIGSTSERRIDTVGIALRGGKFTRLGKGESPTSGKYDSARQVFGAPGCAAMYSRKMLERIGIGSEVFDETLFAWGEDYDVALRAFLAGYESIFIPDATAIHRRGILRRRNILAKNAKAAHLLANQRLVLLKCIPGSIMRRARFGTFAKQLGSIASQHGPGTAAEAMRLYLSKRRQMKAKQKAFLSEVEIDETRLEREVFGQ